MRSNGSRVQGSLWHLIAAVAALLSLPMKAECHEGHQPLPTRGVEVDLRRGRLLLSAPARRVLDVETTEVRSGRRERGVPAYASIVSPWNNHAFVASRLPGRVVSLHVRPGDSVTAGQLLAEIDSLELQTLQRDLQQARTELSLASEMVETLVPAARAGAVAGQRLAEAQNTLRQTQNALAVLQAKGAGLQVTEELERAAGDRGEVAPRLRLFSPIPGTIVHADLAVGKFIEPTEHLFEIVDTSTVWGRLEVLEKDLHVLAEGQEVRLEFPSVSGAMLSAQIDRVGSMLDQRTHQATAWATLQNTGVPFPLLPGMRGQATLVLKSQKEGLLVPEQAVFSDGAEQFVLVEISRTKTGSEYRRRPVVLEGVSQGVVQLVGGNLFPGDRVVTRGGHELAGLFFQGTLRVSPQTARGIGLTVEPAAYREIETIITVDGTIEIPPQQRSLASSPLEGHLRAIHVDRGQAISAGDVVAEVTSLEFQDLQLELLQAHLDQLLWQETWERLNEARDSVPKRTLMEIRNRGERLATAERNLRQKLGTLGLESVQIDDILERRQILDALPVRAPMAGQLVDFDRVLGQVVRADEPLFEIHDLSEARVRVAIPAQEAARVHVEQSVRIRLVAWPGVTIAGSVQRLGPVVGTESRTRMAWIGFIRPGSIRLQHNMLARVIVTTARPEPVLAVPRQAVVHDGMRSFVFIRKPDESFERRLIRTGRSDDRFVEILSGISADDRVAVGGVTHLQTAFSAVR